MSTYRVTDVANYFVDYYSRSVDPVNLPRVQLFVYFAQAESLCRFGRPLFDDRFIAYTSGPAIARLNDYYNEAGNMPISVYGKYDPKVFSFEDAQLLMDVAVYYNKFSTTELQLMTYAKGAPWEQVYSNPNEMAYIDNSLILEYYLSKARIPSYYDVMLEKINDCCALTGEDFVEGMMPETSVFCRASTVSPTWE